MIQQFVEPDAVLGRNGKEMLEAERVKLVRQILAARAVDLVDRQRDRLAELAQHGGEIAIGAGNFGAAVDQKDHLGGAFPAPRAPA